ncbi:dicarboxylate transporter/tellurite-resistance protein TehA [Caballeronia novacaledonica]|uniref:Dicarboxylate transporter/tellurite-resistance protein TehA n=1 Tax=Caballeronia novacaledonica TaxID=1544861 RepID=A0AA37IEH0_9BURK|nr:dicarboxylate transporter/tellurite-resistance protein TehA [Caballeronia novacaledonica]GJH27123.1 dicarboxylate transporter/tellurite-resistance protein TehA [Caballeronia novacaledonica]
MNRPRVPASLFSIVLGLSGLGQSWRVAVRLWHAPAVAGEAVLAAATLVWGALVLAYGAHALRDPARVADEFAHPVGGATPALIGISTFLIAQAVLPYSRPLAWLLTIAGIAWHLAFAVWHTGRLWQGGREIADTAPTIYLPTVAGNFTGAAALGALGAADWAWLLLGAGVFSWLALEPLVIRRLWHREPMPVAERPLVGIQFAPPVVCAAAVLAVEPGSTDRRLVMLLGYGLFQLLVGLRLKSWLGAQPFAYSWWAYSFGVASGTLACVKLALAGVPVAHALALPMFVGANLFIGYLCVRSLACLALARTTVSS